MRIFLYGFLLLAFAATAAVAQNAATGYPTKFVRFIVPYAPGGSSDVLARTLGQKLNAALGQTFVIDNRPGAGSMIGTDIAAKSTPDGYTIILSDMPHTINPSIYAKVPYDPLKDFAPITVIGVSPMFLFAHPSMPAQNVKEFIALAKTQPGKIAIASGRDRRDDALDGGVAANSRRDKADARAVQRRGAGIVRCGQRPDSGHIYLDGDCRAVCEIGTAAYPGRHQYQASARVS